MVIRKRVRNYTNIVPIRFARAVAGGAVRDAPDPDDRGYSMHHPRGLTASTAHGAMVGMMVEDTVRVQVIREDVEAGAALFVTSSDTDVVEITNPAGGGPLPANGIISLRAVADLANRPVIVEVRFGSVDGPVIGELEPHVFTRRNVRVVAHLVTIDGVATAQTAAGLRAVFRNVNAVWRPAGVQFTYVQANTVQETIVGNRFRRRDGSMANLPGPLGPAGTFATPGTITTTMNHAVEANRQWNEFSTLLQIHPVANTVNIYFAQAAPEFNGLTYDHDVARPDGYGIAMQDGGDYNDLAHELGHFLNLDNHADEDSGGTSVRDDMWAIRRLMYSDWPPANPAWRRNVGYGNNRYGSMISLKDLPREQNDNEVLRARRRARNPY